MAVHLVFAPAAGNCRDGRSDDPLRYRDVPAASTFILTCLFAGNWALFSALELMALDLASKTTLVKIQYIFIAGLPLAWAAFALRFTERNRWLTPRNIALSLVVPALTVLLNWTQEAHTLMYTGSRLDTSWDVPLLTVSYSTWFWVHALYSYAMIGLGSILILQRAWRARDIYRWQAGLLGVAPFFPWIANILYITGLAPLPIDLTPFAFAISLLIFGWDAFRYKVLNLIPIAYEKIIERMPDSVIVMDAQHRIIDLNPAAVRFSGMEARAMIGRPVAEVFARWKALVEQCLALDDGRTEVQLDLPNGQQLWLDVRVVTVYDQARHTQVRGKMGILRDITERKRSELALAQARDEALRANQFKTQLLSKVSHDLRTPLSAIRGYTELLSLGRYGSLSSDANRTLERMLENATYLDKLITNLLDQAQLETETLRLNYAPFAADDLAQRVNAPMRVLAEAKGLTFSVETAPDLPEIIGDIDRVQQILLNLIGNAIKFTTTGGITVQMRRDGARNWALAVQDSGTGIPQEAQQLIFEPFRQLENAMSDKRKGYGLGLSIVKELTALMEGDIQVTSTPGQGSTFTVVLPLQPRPELLAAPTANTSALEAIRA
jgi:PAS domain S-box-containing protein